MNKLEVRPDRAILWSVWYLETLAAVAGVYQGRSGSGVAVEPLEYELLSQSGLFNAGYYLGKTNVSAAEQRRALHDFIKAHGSETRTPSILFDSSAYLQAYPDVREAGINPLVHFLFHGILEDRLIGVGSSPPTRPITSQPFFLPVQAPFWRRLPGVRPSALRALKTLATMIDKARAKLLIQLPSLEDLQIDLYVARSDFQRALLHNEKLMRDLTSLRESVSVGEAKEMAAEIERLVAEVATLREDVRDADQEVVRWRARAEQFEMQLSGCTGHDRT